MTFARLRAVRTCLALSSALLFGYALRVPVAQAKVSEAKCGGHRATIVGTSKGEHIRGTAGPDVIVAGAGNDVIRSRGGKDIVCGGP
jgi:Ca2+-binding RTX toxin-like protein